MPADGGAKVLTVPLGIQNRVLYAGPVALLKLPTIVRAEVIQTTKTPRK